MSRLPHARRWATVHPQATADAAVLIAGGLCLLGSQVVSRTFLRFADWCDRRLAAVTDLGGED